MNQVIRCVSGANLNLFRYAAKEGDRHGKVAVTLAAASDEHPFSIHSATIGNRWNTRVWKYAAMLLCVLMLGIGNAWAGSSNKTYYSKMNVTITSGQTGYGTVYVTSSGKTSDTKNSSASSAPTHTYNIYATANAGYKFTSWSGSGITFGSTTTANTTGAFSASSTNSGSPTSKTATASFSVVQVTVAPADVNINAADPSATYPDAAGVVVGFTTSSSNANSDFTTGGSGDSRWTISAWPTHASATSTTFNYKFVGNGSYGTNNRTFIKTVTLKGLNDATVKTCTLTAKYPNPRVVACDAEATDLTIYPTFKAADATQEAVEKTAVFDVVYADNANNFTAAFSGATGSGTWTVTGISVDQANQKATVTYTFNGNKEVGTHTAVLTLTANNCQGWDDTSADGGASATITLTAENTQEATDDVLVTNANEETVYQGDFATALASYQGTGYTFKLLRNVDLGTITATKTINKAMTIDLNGKELRAAVNKSEVPMLTFSASVTVKDSKTGGRIINEHALNGQLRTITVAGGTFTLESGTIAVHNSGQYASAANSTLGVAKYASCASRVIHQNAGTTVNITGSGKLDAKGTRSVYGIVQGSTAATNKSGTTVLNVTGGEIAVEAPYNALGIYAYGKVNMSAGVINTHITTDMVDAYYAADNANNTSNGYGYGIQMKVSVSATASSCYYGTLNMTGGTINVISDRTKAASLYNYGIYLEAAATGVGAGKTATDGTLSQKASAKASIENANITVHSNTYYSYGIIVYGSYNSYDNKYFTVPIKNCNIDVKAYTYTYAICANAAVNSTYGGKYWGDVELTGNTVTAESVTGSTAYGVYVVATTAHIFKDANTTTAPIYFGEYATAAKAVINSGTYTAKTKTSSAYAVCSSTRAKTSYDSETTVAANRKPGGNAEAYPTVIIHGGTFRGETTTSTSRAVSSGGYTTIDGGTFEAFSTTTTAYGLYAVSGKLTASGVTISANATQYAYGAYADCAVPGDKSTAPTGFAYAGEIELNNCDITATTRTSTDARGVSVNATNKLYNWTLFHSDSTSGKWAAATTAEYYRQIYPCTIAGHDSVGIAIAAKATINGCDIKATAETTTAYGVYAVCSFDAKLDSIATPKLNIKNTKMLVKTNGTTTANGIYTQGETVVDGCDITVQPKTTTGYGIQALAPNGEKVTVSNTKISVTGTTTVYGLYGQVDINATHGLDRHGNLILNNGNDVNVSATSGATAYAVYLNATKKAITTTGGAYKPGDYANAATAIINGGKYTAYAASTPAYALGLADPQMQGEVSATPSMIVNDGKFKGTAGSTPYADVSVAGEPGYFVLNGGYYVKDENLDKKLGEGMNKVAVKSGTPEYIEGYRWRITDNMTGEAVCKIVQNSTSTSYASLEEALQVVNASPNSTWTIVMTANYTLSKGDYEIPANTTLLIPYKSGQTTINGATPAWVDKRDTPTPTTPSPYMKLTFANGVNMTVKGKIEASSTTYINQNNWTGVPGGPYGWLQLNEGSHIDLESGAYLFAWGYVTGTGDINAKNGSYIYEDFQMGDWRGGTMGSSVNGNKNGLGSKGVFLLTDYYFQNVECPITYRPGAQSIAYSGCYMEKPNYGLYIQGKSDPVTMVGTSGAMFLMNPATAGENTWVRKEYDAEKDQLVWTLNSGASLGSFRLKISASFIDVDMNTTDYVLPMATNFKIVANEGDINITNDICFLPGSEAIVKKEANLVVPTGKRVFIYDADDWSSYGGYFHKIGYSPSWKACPRLMATSTKLADAKIEVAGTLDIQGSLYTTAGGGNIFSTRENAGKLKLGSAAPASTSAITDFTGNSGQNKTLCQLVGNGSEGHYVGKALTAAKLKNEDGSYTPTTGAASGDIYAYMEDPSDGVYRWLSVKDVGCFTEIKGADTKQYIHPSDFVAVEANANGDHAYHNEGSTRYFVNAEAASGNASCVWWEAEPKGIIDGVTYYMANNENFDNYGTYFYWDNSVSYWKPKKITVTWKDKDGNKITNGSFGDSYSFNTSPQFYGTNPTWANTSTEKHDWIGWRDEDGNIYDKNATLPAATADETVYTAYFETSKYQYTITFKNDDNSDLWAGLVDAGTTGAELQALFETKYNEKTGSTIPLKASSVDKVYTFSGWDNTLATVTAAATYTASYTGATRQYHVTFYNYDAASVLYETDVDYNKTRPVYGGVTPFRANTSAFSYEWTGWQQGAIHYGTTDNLALVTGDVYYVATFSQTDLKYQVLFKRQDGSIIDAPFFNFEESPTAFPANPTMASTVSTDYTFREWSPATLAPVTEDGKVYTALFDESPRQYTAHFVNYNGVSLNVDQTIDYNTVPAYTGATPMKPNDSRNSFEFSGWAWEAGAGWEAGSIGVGEAFPAIKGDITFTAQFTETLLQFNVRYIREDGTPLKEEKLKWGQSTTGFPSPVASYEDETYSYTFDHWSPATVVNPVTTDATYTAYFTQAIKTYSISNFGISPAGYGTVSPASVTGIPSGSSVTVNGNKITVNGQTITATPTAADAQYTYEFDHWNNEPATVTANVTNIEAVFTRTTNTYTVTWKDGDVTLETDENVAYGTTPTYNGATPTKVADEDYTYTFNSWTPDVSSVTGNATYTATYTSTANVASVAASGTPTTYHATVADAISVANGKTNAVVTMLQNASVESEVEITAAMTIDLNDKTISSAVTTAATGVFKINASGKTVTIKDNGTGGKISHKANCTGYLYGINLFAGSLNVEDGYIYAENTNTTAGTANRACGIMYADKQTNQASITMSGGTVEAKRAKTYVYGISIYTGNCGLTMTGGTVKASGGDGVVRGIYTQGTAVLSNVTVTAEAAITGTNNCHAVFSDKDGNYTINSGTYTAISTSTGTNAYAISLTKASSVTTGGSAIVKGGRFSGKSKELNISNGTITLQGGYYVHNTELEAKCADNYHVLPNADATYKYKVAEAYTVTFNANGHGTAPASQLIEKGQKATAPAEPTATGYTFGGWYKEAGCKNEWDFASDVVTAATPLYAKWTANPYTIAFDSNGGSSVASITQNYGTAVTAPANPTREGYTFNGWSPAVPSTMPVNGLTCVAQWTVNPYTITFDSNGGSSVASITQNYGTAVTAPADPTREGYTFNGWSPAVPSTMPVNGLTCVAQWTVNPYTITFNSNGGSAVASITQNYGTAVTAPADPTREGYTFAGWNPAVPSTMPVNGLTCVAQWTVNPYTITFDSNGGSSVASITQNYGTAVTAPADPTREGYTFNGWSPAVPSTMPVNGLTCVAQWTVNPYTITFDSNGGSAVASITQNYGTAVTAPADPTREGYTFNGWSPAVPSTMPVNGLTCVAQWTVATYEVALNANGGTGGSTSVTMTYNSADHTAITNPTRTGYTFHSWNTTASSSTRKQVISSKGVMSENVSGYTGVGGVWIRTTMPTTLYARWSQKSYTTTFTHNGNGSISYNGAVVDAGGTAKVYHVSAKSLVATPNTGYHFTGWTVSGTNASKVTIADLSAASTTIKATAASATVTAGFAPDEYTISYKDQGDAEFSGVHGSGYPTTHTYGTATILVSPTKEGYTFDGWYDNAECTGTALTEIGATDYTADFTLYAKWTLNKYSFTIGVTPTSYGNVDVASITQIPHGSAVTVTGNKFTVNGTTVTATPTATTAEYTYAFSKWNNVPNTVTANVTNITAEFTRTINQYTLTVEANNDAMGTVSGGGMYDYNTVRTITATPKAGFKFVEWNDHVTSASREVTVTADVTFTATFDYDIANYTVKHWQQNIDNDEYTEVVADRQTDLSGTIGTATAAVANTYTGFEAQDIEQQTIALSGTVVNIYYDRITYTIIWDVKLNGEQEAYKVETLRYGATPSYGENPTKEQSVSQVFTFSGWDPTPYAVDKNQTYSGSFNVAARPYTITFVNDDNTTVLQATEVGWGSTPGYSGTPESTVDESYEFIGWTPAIAVVTGEATYVATYKHIAGPIDVEGKDTVTVEMNTETTTTTVHVNGALHVPENVTLSTTTFTIEAISEVIDTDDAFASAQSESGEATGNIVADEMYFDLILNNPSNRRWNAFTVPFIVDLRKSGHPIQINNETLTLGSGYDIIYYNGATRAEQGPVAACWEYVEDPAPHGGDSILYPGRAYMIASASRAIQTVRFRKATDPSLVYDGKVSVAKNATDIATGNNGGWNGIGNPRMYHAVMNAGVTLCQVHDGGKIGEDGYRTYDMDDKKLVVGKAVFVQVGSDNDNVSIVQAEDQPTIKPQTPSDAPRRTRQQIMEDRYDVQIAATGGVSADRLLILAEEDKEDKYVILKDLSKAGVSPVRAQMWVDRYGEKLCMNTTALINNKANYPLTISVPKAGEYDIYLNGEPKDGTSLYLTYDGRAIWNLTYGGYTATLEKGLNTHYGLRVVISKTATEIEEATIENGDAVRKVIVNDNVFIIRNGEMYSITGQKAQ